MIIKKNLFLVLVLSQLSYAQSYHQYASEFFFGLEASSKAEAMGKGSVAAITDATAQHYNPALLNNLEGLNITYSYSTPYYVLVDAQYNYAGITYRLNGKHSIGMSYHNFNSGNKSEFLNNTFQIDDWSYMSLTTSYSYELSNNFSIGTNLNYFNVHGNRTSSNVSDNNFHAMLIDVGIIKKFDFFASKRSSHSFYFGGSLKNILQTKLEINSSEVALPSQLSLGIAYRSEFMENETKLIESYIDLEYKGLLNGDYFSTYRFGSYVLFYEFLNIYVGYYTRSNEENYEGDTSKDQISAFTYGLGVNFPLKKIINTDLPIYMSINLALLGQPSTNTNYDDWENFKNIDINLNYKF